MSTCVIGDVHGCLDEFRELIDKLRQLGEHDIVLIGDLMDKGPDPVGCVQFAREIGADMVLGNHEEKHLRWRKHEERHKRDPKYKNPMRRLDAKKLCENAALTDADVDWLRERPTMMFLRDNWLAVHAGVLPGIAIEAQREDEMLRVRWVDAAGEYVPLDPQDPRQPEGTRLWAEAYDGPMNVVYGHAAHSLSKPRVDKHTRGVECWGIDTGCVYGGRLTALVLETRTVVQVQAKRVYDAPPWPIPA